MLLALNSTQHAFKQSYASAILLALMAALLLSSFYFNNLNNVSAQANSTISFQTKIVDKVTGVNISNGSPACVVAGADTCDFRFSIYDAPSGGSLLWQEVHPNVELGDTGGIISIELNSICDSWDSPSSPCAGSGIDWGSDPDLYLQVELDSDGNGNFASGGPDTLETFDRKIFTSVPFAYYANNAGSVGGLTADGLVQLSPGSAQSTGNTSNALIWLNEDGTGTPDLLRLQVAGSDLFRVTNNGSTSVGTSTSTALLTVAPSTSAQASLRLVSSSGTNPSAPNSGDLWWNGTNLYFYDGSASVDLLESGSSGGPSASAFRAYRSGNQTLTPSTITKIQFGNENFDLNNEFDSTTNYRFSPTQDGIYLMFASTKLIDTAASASYSISLTRNGSGTVISRDFIPGPVSAGLNNVQYSHTATVQALVNHSGSDYYEVFAEQSNFAESNRTIQGGTATTYFSAVLISPGGSGSSLFTEASGVTYPTNIASDFAVGGSSLVSPFSVDVSANLVRIGDGANDANNPTLTFYASDASSSSSISVLDGGAFSFTDSILPGTNDTYDLGSSTSRWRELYLGPSSLNIGVDGNQGVISYDTTNNWFGFNPSGDGTPEFYMTDAGKFIAGSTIKAGSSASDPFTCNSGVIGEFYFNTSSNSYRYCNGSNWLPFGSTASSSDVAFRVNRNNAAQTVSAATPTRIDFTTEAFDLGSNFDNATNYRFTAPRDGVYIFNGSVSANVTGGAVQAQIYKNGSLLKRSVDWAEDTSAADVVSQVSVLDYASQGDYYELWGVSPNTSILGTVNSTYFSGSLVGGGAEGYLYDKHRQDVTTNNVVAQQVVRKGWGWVQSSGGTSIEQSVNFGITFSDTPIVIATPAGYSTSDPSTIGDCSSGSLAISSQAKDQSTTGFTMRFYANGASIASNERHCYTWIAIGSYASGYGADLAENFVTADVDLQPGEVVSIDLNNDIMVRRSTERKDADVMGIVSTAPGLVLGSIDGLSSDFATAASIKAQQDIQELLREGKVAVVQVALQGRIPLKVSLENGPINRGDYLMASSIPGYAMKADGSGQIVGRALEAFNGNQAMDTLTATERDAIQALVETGEQIDFTSLMKEQASSGVIMAFAERGYYQGTIDAENLLAQIQLLEDGVEGQRLAIALISTAFVLLLGSFWIIRRKQLASA